MTPAEAAERLAEAARKITECSVYGFDSGRKMDAVKGALADYDAARATDNGRKASFDVGEGRVGEGDEALYQGRKCKVLTVYHDGDVQIELCTYPTVKWREVSPLPAPPSGDER